jgi:hypothetical protein
MHGRVRPEMSVGWRTGTCPERRGQHGLGVDWWRWCKREVAGSPGDSAKIRERDAWGGLVGRAERRGGDRGGLSSRGPERGSGERGRAHP